MATYDQKSLYKDTPQDNARLGIFVPRRVPYTETDEVIIVTKSYEHRPDLLSYDIYDTTRYWWVFAARNPDVLKDPIYDLKAGIELFIPSKELIEGTLN